MRERPILFSAPMVRAILEGRKTMTRRIAKLTDAGHVKEPGGHRRWHPADMDARQACPYGQPGDRLWVRETFGDCTPGADALVGTRWDKPWYRAEADEYGLLGHDGEGPVYVDDVKWRPSIHMPRRASRITLEITAVCVERLQEISEADVQAEGCTGSPLGPAADRLLFPTLWESINGPGSWDANPWVWVVGFRKVKP
jgi:hypothetical protein